MKNIIFGKVIKGKRKGKKIGFPTANIELAEKINSGVYAGSIGIGDKKYKAGIFVDLGGKLLEAHVVGYSGNLYGEEIEIEIGNRMRDAMKFENDEELKKRIKKDIELICSRE